MYQIKVLALLEGGLSILFKLVSSWSTDSLFTSVTAILTEKQ